MFDSASARFIRSAPALEGLDRDRLPELLTETHTRIATLRLRLGDERVAISHDFAEDLNGLRRLARTFAAYAVAVTDEQSAAAAFVAANAYQLLHEATAAGLLPGSTGTYLRRETVSDDITALLLFLAAGQTADAREVAANLSPYEPGTMASSLVTGLVFLSRGQLDRLSNLRAEDVDRLYERGEDPATEALWQRLVLGLRVVANGLLGERLADANARGGTASEIFEQVRALSLSPLSVWTNGPAGLRQAPLGVRWETSLSTFSGPHHVASLLRAATDKLFDDAVVRVPTPPGVPDEGWRDYLKEIAGRRERPFLWRNHKEAIEQGLLNPGVSAVVSYPTGAGKSTLSELKIAATVLRGRRAIFLAPTRALVWQTYRALSDAFPHVSVTESPVGENTYEESETAADATILVMTPERCLTFLGSEPASFAEVDLIVFDECHLLHPREGVRDRRSLDAMLCFLGLLDVATGADVLLLSAMMRNTTELAAWISFATGGRRCIEANTGWKPTRQVRGCLVFDRAEAAQLQQRVSRARVELARARRRNPPVVLKRSLQLHPLGVFGLTQTWQPRVGPTDFALIPLLPSSVTVALSQQWQLTPNKNEVAAVLAARMARAGIKVLVFVQNKDYCQSVCDRVRDELDAGEMRLVLNPSEQAYFDAAAEDLGDSAFVIGPVATAAAPHHSLLLPAERRLNESAFARRDGVNVLVATPTLAQGMNLPAEAVLIVGDQRFDAAVGDRARIAAHELLNAAGRAGRAGHHASGVVIVIPDSLIRVAGDLSNADPALQQLNGALLSKVDQCLDIGDPIEILLDRVEIAVAGQDRLMRYFVTRLPVSDDPTDPSSTASRVLGRSLGAYRASVRHDAAGFETRLETALTVRRVLATLPEELVWIDQIASRTGYAPARVHQLARALAAGTPPPDARALDWIRWIVRWLETDATLLADLIDASTLDDALTPGEVPDHAGPEAYSALLHVIAARVERWISGARLNELEAQLHPPVTIGRKCKSARRFVGRFVVEFAHLAGTVAQVRRRQLEVAQQYDPVPLGLSILGACVREGLASPEQLAIRYETDAYRTSRIACHRLGNELAQQTEGVELGFSELRAAARDLLAARGIER